MTKKCLYFLLCLFVFQNAGHADTAALRNVNQQYMELMLGSEDILPVKATPEQINQMIDGCITAGISDRLYHLGDKSALFKAQFEKFTGYKKLDVQLAYAFYMLGYGKFNSFEGITNHMVEEGCALEPNFIAEIATLCNQVFTHGDIFEYRDRLEDVIKRASKPLRFDDFVEVVPERAASPDLSEILSPVTTRSRSSVLTMRPKANAEESGLYKKLQELGVASGEIQALLGDYAENYVEETADISGVSASLASLAFSPVSTEANARKIERYYTKAELAKLASDKAAQYEMMLGQSKAAKAISMVLGIEKKYEGE